MSEVMRGVAAIEEEDQLTASLSSSPGRKTKVSPRDKKRVAVMDDNSGDPIMIGAAFIPKVFYDITKSLSISNIFLLIFFYVLFAPFFEKIGGEENNRIEAIVAGLGVNQHSLLFKFHRRTRRSGGRL